MRSPMPVIECRGTPREMGRQFGEAAREQIEANTQVWHNTAPDEEFHRWAAGARATYERLLPELAEVSPPNDLASLQDLLKSHEPWAPCRHGGPHVSVTEWSIVGIPRERKLLVASGPPCHTSYETIDVD